MARNARQSPNKRRGTSKGGRGHAPKAKAAKQAKRSRAKKTRSRQIISAEERLERFVEQYQNRGMSWAEARLSARAKMREKAR